MTKNGDAFTITTESFDILVDPLQRKLLIFQAHISRIFDQTEW